MWTKQTGKGYKKRVLWDISYPIGLDNGWLVKTLIRPEDFDNGCKVLLPENSLARTA